MTWTTPSTATDLIEFGRSPLRWVRSDPPDPAATPDLLEVVRCTLLSQRRAQVHLCPAPRNLRQHHPRLPQLQERRPGRQVPRLLAHTHHRARAEKKWSGNAEYCIKWAEKQADAGIGVVPTDRWETAQAISLAILGDPDCKELLDHAATLALVDSRWEDPDTGLTIPLRETIDLVGGSETNLETALARLVLVSDSAPAPWAMRAYTSGAHIRAALQRRLWNDAGHPPRDYHLWILAERTAPHLVSRRSAAPELLALGDTILGRSAQRLRHCLKSGIWPAFDRSAPSTLEGFTPVYPRTLDDPRDQPDRKLLCDRRNPGGVPA